MTPGTTPTTTPKQNLFTRTLDAAQRRFKRARPGSVLIMVVSLLVLLALIGTAAMSTARLDRVAAGQHSANTQVDILAEGVKEMVLAQLVNDLFGEEEFNFTDSSNSKVENRNQETRDAMIASRLPERLMPFRSTIANFDKDIIENTEQEAFWRTISYPPIKTNEPDTGNGRASLKFDVPTEDSSDTAKYALYLPKPAWKPTTVTVNGQTYPALQAFEAVPTLPPGNPNQLVRPWENPMTKVPDGAVKPYRAGEPFLAADADGDGIADAVLFKLPISPMGGVTYYAAVRVIDNAAAINVNTAGNPDQENGAVTLRDVATGDYTVAKNNLSLIGTYPASVMLENLLDASTYKPKSSASVKAFEYYQYRGQKWLGSPKAGADNYDLTAYVEYPDPTDPTKVKTKVQKRNDVAFLTPGDMQHYQLGRRLDYPGNSNFDSNYFGNGARPFGLGDSMVLAYGFTLVNPSANDSLIETILYRAAVDSLGTPDKPSAENSKPYLPFDTTRWFRNNFDYWPADTSLSYKGKTAKTGYEGAPPLATDARQFLRPMLTTYNPVRNYVFKHFPANPTSQVELYPTKANLNTASLTELRSAYADVMMDLPGTTPFDDEAAMKVTDAYQGMRFSESSPFVSETGSDQHPARMFRSPLRPFQGADNNEFVTNQMMHPLEVLHLRSAIAAVNTVSLRSDFTTEGTAAPANANEVQVQTMEVDLPRPNGEAPRYRAKVFGLTRQPFITEVLVNNNPYPLGNGNGNPTPPGGNPPAGDPPPVNPPPAGDPPPAGNPAPAAPLALQDPPADPPPPVDPPPGGGAGGGAGDKQNRSGFAAIELYNPYDTELNLEGYYLKVIDRSRFPNLKLKPLGTGNTPTPAAGGDPPAAGSGDFIFGSDAKIPPFGYLVVWNYKADAGADDIDSAKYLPANLKDKIPTERDEVGGLKIVYCAKLHDMIGLELVLARKVGDSYMPIDSFDCTGLQHKTADKGAPPPANETVEGWHYVRANSATAGRAWHHVYPGRYQSDGEVGTPPTDDGPPPKADGRRRHQGIETTGAYNPATADPWATTGDPGTPILLGTLATGHEKNSRDKSPLPEDVNEPPATSSFPIQIYNADTRGQFHKVDDAGDWENKRKRFAPLNGFARAGDAMQATFIGAYHITKISGGAPPAGDAENRVYTEINAVTMDAAMAEDTDPMTDYDPGTGLPLEDIGRFSPLPMDLYSHQVKGFTDPASPKNDTIEDPERMEPDGHWFNYDLILTGTDGKRQYRRIVEYKFDTNKNVGRIKVAPAFNPAPKSGESWEYKIQRVRYGWADKLLDYVTAIHGPALDYMPNKPPNEFKLKSDVGADPGPHQVKNVSDPTRIVNRGPVEDDPETDPKKAPQTEDDVPIEGLININTANWKVLAQLPLVVKADGGKMVVDRIATERLAKRIVYFRDVDDGTGLPLDPAAPNSPRRPHPHGAFRNLMELNMIPEFVTGEGTIPFALDPTRAPNYGGEFALQDYGDYSPMSNNPIGDGVHFDFEKKYLQLTRLSNLLTTRSDCYTVYLQVQGWRDAGTSSAKMVVQRRLAFIADRSRITPTNRTPGAYNIPVPAGN